MNIMTQRGLNTDDDHDFSQDRRVTLDDVANAVAGLNEKVLRLGNDIHTLKNQKNSNVTTQLYSSGYAYYQPRTNPRMINQNNASKREKSILKPDFEYNDKEIERSKGRKGNAISKSKKNRQKSWYRMKGGAREQTELYDQKSENRNPTVERNEQSRENEQFSMAIGNKIPEKCQNRSIKNAYCNCKDKLARKIKKKKISRGVQYDVPDEREKKGRSLFNCFRSRSNSKKSDLSQDKELKVISTNDEIDSTSKSKKDKRLRVHLKKESERSSKMRPREEKATDKLQARISKDIKSNFLIKKRSQIEKLSAGAKNEVSQSTKVKSSDIINKQRTIKEIVMPIENNWKNRKSKIQNIASKENIFIVDNSAGKEIQNASNNDKHPVIYKLNKDRERKWSQLTRRSNIDLYAKLTKGSDNIRDKRTNESVNKNNKENNKLWTAHNNFPVIDKFEAINVKRRLDACIAELNAIIGDASIIFQETKSSKGKK